jgi:nucleotide sugar dehydrogenase
MKIQVIGVGVVGGAQAYLASKLGHEVFGFDQKLSDFPYARIVKEPEKNVDLTFICTPESVVPEVVDKLVASKVKGLYVMKSTVPPKTTQKLMEKHEIHICHNPEFLVERIAFESISHPSVVVIGECCPSHSKILKDFYNPLGCPIVITNPTTSEIAKLTINSYLATLISFWNEIDRFTSSVGVSTKEVAAIAKCNPRVSAYGTEFFGAPFGGKCLPKDLEQLIQFYHQVNITPFLLESIRDFNKMVK